MATKRTKRKDDTVESESDEEVTATDSKSGAKVVKKKNSGMNYSAICILVMMVLPALITLGIQAYDMMYPKAAADRLIRERLNRCYAAAKPKEVVDIDKIIKKYLGKEKTLFATLRNKYSKHPDCHLG